MSLAAASQEPLAMMSSRTLVISDIHGNLPALEAVLARPHDSVICLGDIVGRGVQSGACLRRLREEHAAIILGNHEFVLVQGLDDSDLRSGFPTLSPRPSSAYSDDLTASDIDFLAGLPRWLRLELPAGTCACFHGTPLSLFANGIGADVAAWKRALATTAPADVVFVGHTHMPYELRVESTRVVNPGSVGLPADGDPRAAYAEIDGTTIALKRTEYAVEDAVRAVERSALTTREAEALAAWLRTGTRRPRSHSRLDFGVRRHIDGAGAREAAADA